MPSRMKIIKNPVFLHFVSKFQEIFLFVLKYVYFLVSEDDKCVFLTSKNYGQSL